MVYDEEDDAFDQDKELVEDDTENIDSPINENEVETEEDLDDALDESIDDNIEYDDSDELEDSYEDESDL